MYKYNLAEIVGQVDERTFLAHFFLADLTVAYYLSDRLYYQNVRLVKGDVIKLELKKDSSIKDGVHTIIELIYSKKEQDELITILMPITTGLLTLTRHKVNYNSFQIGYFFDDRHAEVFHSTLGLKTVQDLVDANTLSLARVLFHFSEGDREQFFERFENFLIFFDSF